MIIVSEKNSHAMLNKAFAKVVGEKVNRGAGSYGFEIPCVYHLYRPKLYIIVDKMTELVDPLTTSGLV